jgi:hypothetical protein
VRTGFDVASRVSQKYLCLGSRERFGNARMSQLLIGIPESVGSPLGGLALGAVERQGRRQPFGSSPRGHDLSDKLLHDLSTSDGLDRLGPRECTRSVEGGGPLSNWTSERG